MKIFLIPHSISTLHDLSTWLGKQKLEKDSVLGVRQKSRITNIQGFQRMGARYTTYQGIPIYFNY